MPSKIVTRVKKEEQHIMKENLHRMFVQSGRPEYVRKKLLSKAAGNEGSHELTIILRSGWNALKQAKMDQITSARLVLALIFSATAGMGLQWFDLNPADDFWKDLRSTFRDIFSSLMILISLVISINIVLSLVYATSLSFYCVDFDDFLSYQDRNIDGKFWGLTLLVFFLVSEAMSFGAIVLLSNPAATIVFVSCQLVTLWTFSWIFSVYLAERFNANWKVSKQSAHWSFPWIFPVYFSERFNANWKVNKQSAHYVELIECVYREVVSSRDQPSSEVESTTEDSNGPVAALPTLLSREASESSKLEAVSSWLSLQ